MMGRCCWTATFDAMMIMDAQRGMIKFKTKLSFNWYNNRNRASLRFFYCCCCSSNSCFKLTLFHTRSHSLATNLSLEPFHPTTKKKMHFLLQLCTFSSVACVCFFYPCFFFRYFRLLIKDNSNNNCFFEYFFFFFNFPSFSFYLLCVFFLV